MKIKNLYLIAMGTLLSSNAFSQELDKVQNDINLNKTSDMDNKIGQLTFICPMHPEIVQSEFGTCPICGMDLIEKNIKSIKNNEVQISAGMQQNLNINTAKAKMKRITPKFKSYGKVKYNEESIIHYHLRVNGWIENSFVLNDGQEIKKGDKLFEIYSEELIVAQQDLLLTIKSNNKDLIKRSKKRLSLLGFNKELINRITKTKTVLYTVPFYAESSGIIKNFNIRKGMYINESNELFSIVNPKSIWIDGFIFNDEKELVSINNKVKITYNNKEFNSFISYIYPELDSETLALKYRVNLLNENINIKPNAIVNLEMYSNKKITGLFIPIESLIQTEHKNTVIVKTKTGFKSREVLVGFKNKKSAQILKGLPLNSEIVTSGHFLIDSEASLKGSINRLGDNNE